MVRALPTVEVADDADLIGTRRPHRKRNPAPPLVSHHMRAQLFVDTNVLAFAEEVKIEFAERRCEVRAYTSGLSGPVVRPLVCFLLFHHR